MLLPFSRLVVLALTYLTILTSAAPVIQDGSALVSKPALPEHQALNFSLGERARGKAIKPRPKPKPVKTHSRKPVPTQTTIRRPVPIKTTIRKPVPAKTPEPAPKQTARPTVKRPTPAKPTAPVKRPTAVPKPPMTPHKPVTHSTTKLPVKATPKPTKTTSKTPTSTPTKAPQCPVKKPTKKGPRALMEWVIGLVKRDPAEFIGWHGTNSRTAALWHEMGFLAKPQSSGGNAGGTSGADHELGEGVYVTDAMETAHGFANNNAVMNPGTDAMLCAIFARSRTAWRAGMNKVWLPKEYIRDSKTAALHKKYEKDRISWIKSVIPHSSGGDVARFGPLDKNRPASPNQVVIPSALTSKFYALCVNADATDAELPVDANPHIDYDSERHPWNVRDTPCA